MPQGMSEYNLGPFSNYLTEQAPMPRQQASGWEGGAGQAAAYAANFLQGVAQGRNMRMARAEMQHQRNRESLAMLAQLAEHAPVIPSVKASMQADIAKRLIAEVAHADNGIKDGKDPNGEQQHPGFHFIKGIAQHMLGRDIPKVQPVSHEDIGKYTQALLDPANHITTHMEKYNSLFNQGVKEVNASMPAGIPPSRDHYMQNEKVMQALQGATTVLGQPTPAMQMVFGNAREAPKNLQGILGEKEYIDWLNSQQRGQQPARNGTPGVTGTPTIEQAQLAEQGAAQQPPAPPAQSQNQPYKIGPMEHFTGMVDKTPVNVVSDAVNNGQPVAAYKLNHFDPSKIGFVFASGDKKGQLIPGNVSLSGALRVTNPNQLEVRTIADPATGRPQIVTFPVGHPEKKTVVGDVPERTQYRQQQIGDTIYDVEVPWQRPVQPIPNAAPGTPTPAPVPNAPGNAPDLRNLVTQAAGDYGLDPEALTRHFNQESRFKSDAVSPKGAQGVAQFMPGTAAERGVDPSNPQQSVLEGARYLAELKARYGGDERKAFAAYNAGPGTIDRAVQAFGDKWDQHLPAETQNHLKAIYGDQKAAKPTGPMTADQVKASNPFAQTSKPANVQTQTPQSVTAPNAVGVAQPPVPPGARVVKPAPPRKDQSLSAQQEKDLSTAQAAEQQVAELEKLLNQPDKSGKRLRDRTGFGEQTLDQAGQMVTNLRYKMGQKTPDSDKGALGTKAAALTSSLRVIATGPYLKGIRNGHWVAQIQQHFPDIHDSPALMGEKIDNIKKILSNAQADAIKMQEFKRQLRRDPTPEEMNQFWKDNPPAAGEKGGKTQDRLGIL